MGEYMREREKFRQTSKRWICWWNIYEQEVSCMSFDIECMQSIYHGVLYHLMQVVFWEVTDVVDAYEQYWEGRQERNGQTIIFFPLKRDDWNLTSGRITEKSRSALYSTDEVHLLPLGLPSSSTC